MSDNLLKNAIEKIAEMAAPTIREINGETWSSKHMERVRLPEDTPEQYTVNTLEGLVNLIKREGVKWTTEEMPLFVVVRGPDLVEVDSSHTPGRNTAYLRMHFYRAVSDVPEFITHTQPLENMIIKLRAQCAASPDRTRLLDLLSSVSLEDGVSTVDNGVTQTVTQRRGVALKENLTIDNPYFVLKPYRTFLEIDQPASEFLLRVSEGGEVGLFQADGGAWKLDAKRRIGAWLAEALKEEIENGRVVVTI